MYIFDCHINCFTDTCSNNIPLSKNKASSIHKEMVFKFYLGKNIVAFANERAAILGCRLTKLTKELILNHRSV